MEREYEVAAKYLKEHSFKLTGQRKKIIDAIFATHEHFSADDLHDVLREKGEAISKATVYRTLSLLAESGFIESRDFGRGQLYYEHVLGHEHHDHMICTSCGKVFEFRNAEIEKLKERIAKSRGFRMQKHSLRIFGTCKDCFVS
ncbi:MAG: transcriptional repressor [Planctomycetes bacterium]|jgi:Fur family ferric uptake transcriptional regulator|nr:transcriptional repressor [Planctomycetota bacterium]